MGEMVNSNRILGYFFDLTILLRRLNILYLVNDWNQNWNGLTCELSGYIFQRDWFVNRIGIGFEY